MGKYIPFCLTKLLSALHRKDWVEVENQQKLGYESVMRRRGVELSKANRPVTIVRPILLRLLIKLRKEIYQQPFQGYPLISLKHNL